MEIQLYIKVNKKQKKPEVFITTESPNKTTQDTQGSFQCFESRKKHGGKVAETSTRSP